MITPLVGHTRMFPKEKRTIEREERGNRGRRKGRQVVPSPEQGANEPSGLSAGC